MKQEYIAKRLGAASLTIIDTANEIISEYVSQGFVLTLRQLYYQFVARGLLPNTTQNYKRLGGIISDGRLAGLIDWDAIEDRTRNLESLATWESPEDIVTACSKQYRIDLWAEQACRPEVWIEKEALAGVFERTCHDLRVDYIACRGYMSQSEMREAARRFLRYTEAGQRPIVLHFGDHDPSGIDMSRDIEDRLNVFMGGAELEFQRLALNLDQVKKYRPPPNPAKTTDARFGGYASKYGLKSWELDALDPKVLDALIRKAVLAVRDEARWRGSQADEAEQRRLLSAVAEGWEDVTDGL